jgi:hypothetical protein
MRNWPAVFLTAGAKKGPGGLFFASQKAVAQEIVTDIFKRYKDRGACV